MTQEQVDQFVQSSISGIPLGRPGTTDEIAKAVLFLASDDSSDANGIELFVDGGLVKIGKQHWLNERSNSMKRVSEHIPGYSYGATER